MSENSKDPDLATPPQENSGHSGTTLETAMRAMQKMASAGETNSLVEMQTTMMGLVGNPLTQKMNEKHIDEVLKLAIQHDTNEADLLKKQQQIDSQQQTSGRRYDLVYFLVFVGLILFIIHEFHDQPTVLIPILSAVGGVVMGFIGGMGYAKNKTISKSE
jgi:hypothetical protein